AMKPAEQARAVTDKLRDLNFKLPETSSFKAEEDKIVEFTCLGNGVKDITPLAALKHVRILNLDGTQPVSETDKERVKDLAPLQGMPLVELHIRWSHVTDLSL